MSPGTTAVASVREESEGASAASAAVGEPAAAVWHAAAPISAAAFAELRLRAIFEACKWDPQVGDTDVLSSVPLWLTEHDWQVVARLGRQLAVEALAAEAELAGRPDLFVRLGLPRPLRRVLAANRRGPVSAGVARLMRFDFHLTTDGWRISEVNSDVPGGFNEASGFAALVARETPGLRLPGDPTRDLARAIAAGVEPGGTVALVHATAYTDDRQVMVYLGRHLEACGVRTVLAAPDHLHWADGVAGLPEHGHPGALAALVRFFPGEWLPDLPRASGWPHFLRGGRTPVCNPATALLTQSKRFPLTWADLRTPLPTWAALLPETVDPRQAGSTDGEEWVLKPAFGRVGEDVGIRGVTPEREWQALARQARRHPGEWIAQRRFAALPVDTALGRVYPCLGVYTVDDRVVGAYGRLGRQPLINGSAQDCAVLVRPAADTG